MDFSTILILSLILIPFLLLLTDHLTRKRLPPGPRPWPVIGNLLQLGEKPHADFAKLAQKYGDLFTLRLGSQTVVVASSPASAAEILKTHDKTLSGRYVFQSFRVKEHVENSIVWCQCNDNWKMLRKVCRTELFTPKMIESQASVREEKAMEMVKFLKGREGQAVKVAEVVFGTLVNIFGNLIFSQDIFDLNDPTSGSMEMKEQLWKMLELGNTTNPADYFPFLGRFDLFGQRRAVAECLQQIYSVWGVMLKERRRNEASSHDFVNVLINAGLDDQKINALLMELFGAGTETSASTIEWAIAELTKNPCVARKIREEMTNVLGEAAAVKESHILHLPYLQAFVKETLRLHPPTPLLLPRRALETCQVMGYTIPKECQIMVNAWAIGRDPRTWKDALAFSPERFLNSNVDFKGNDFELIPFGGGRRICPGIPLASQFLHLIVATLVQNIEWSLPDGRDSSELTMEDKFGLTLQKDPPLYIVPKCIS